MQTMVTITHNPACGTSRNTLALLRHAGIEPCIIEYLQTPPSREALRAMIGRAGLTLQDVVRKKGAPLAVEGLDDEVLLDAMLAHPVLINRPIVVTEKGVALCRPSDVVLDLLPRSFLADFCKEDGAPFLRDEPASGGDPALAAALAAEGLPVDDLAEPGRRFFAYRSLGGALLGFGAYELHGSDALLRSIVVTKQARGKSIGRNLLPLLAYRVLRAGARRAFLMTLTAADFFAKIGYKKIERTDAPAAILASRQAASLCPATTVLMSRKLGF
jgi:arsenate reductase (glutaredoxin)